jgi:hypothetical protein
MDVSAHLTVSKDAALIRIGLPSFDPDTFLLIADEEEEVSCLVITHIAQWHRIVPFQVGLMSTCAELFSIYTILQKTIGRRGSTMATKLDLSLPQHGMPTLPEPDDFSNNVPGCPGLMVRSGSDARTVRRGIKCMRRIMVRCGSDARSEGHGIKCMRRIGGNHEKAGAVASRASPLLQRRETVSISSLPTLHSLGRFLAASFHVWRVRRPARMPVAP